MYYSEKVLEAAVKYYGEYLGIIITLNSQIDDKKVAKHPIVNIEEFLEFEHQYSFTEDRHVNIKERFEAINFDL